MDPIALRAAVMRDKRRSETPKTDMDLHQELIDWLSQMSGCDPDDGLWDRRIRVFPPKDDEPAAGPRAEIRLAVRLYTRVNTYLITVMECLGEDARGMNILSAHVNWQDKEWQIQKTLEDGYSGGFVDMPRGRHTVWAQTFGRGELAQALDAAAAAILGRELIDPPDPDVGEPRLKRPHPTGTSFPGESADE